MGVFIRTSEKLDNSLQNWLKVRDETLECKYTLYDVCPVPMAQLSVPGVSGNFLSLFRPFFLFNRFTTCKLWRAKCVISRKKRTDRDNRPKGGKSLLSIRRAPCLSETKKWSGIGSTHPHSIIRTRRFSPLTLLESFPFPPSETFLRDHCKRKGVEFV